MPRSINRKYPSAASTGERSVRCSFSTTIAITRSTASISRITHGTVASSAFRAAASRRWPATTTKPSGDGVTSSGSSTPIDRTDAASSVTLPTRRRRLSDASTSRSISISSNITSSRRSACVTICEQALNSDGPHRRPARRHHHTDVVAPQRCDCSVRPNDLHPTPIHRSRSGVADHESHAARHRAVLAVDSDPPPKRVVTDLEQTGVAPHPAGHCRSARSGLSVSSVQCQRPGV